MVANGQLETPKSTIELNFEVGGIEFHEIIGLMFFHRNQTEQVKRQGILNFPFFSMQLKTADYKYSNVLDPILNPTEITIPPNDRVLTRTISLLYPENAVTGILQPSDLLHEEGDITLCQTLVTLNDGNILIPMNNFTDHPYKLKKGLHIANFSVMTPEQMKYVEPVDPASTWHPLQQEQAAQYVRSLIKTNEQKSSKLRKLLVSNSGEPRQPWGTYTNTEANPTRITGPTRPGGPWSHERCRISGKVPIKLWLERLHSDSWRQGENLRLASGIPWYFCKTQIRYRHEWRIQGEIDT